MPVDNTEPLSVYRAGPGYARCLAEMILMASRGHHRRGYMDNLLDLPGERTLDVLAALARHPAQLWGRVDNAFVALVDGVCSGMVSVRPARTLGEFPFSREAFTEVGQRLGLAPEAVARTLERQNDLARRFHASATLLPEGTWLVEYLAVRRENRAAGVARGLMARVEAEAKAAKASGIELFCEMGNERAQRLYSTLGFRPVWEFRYPQEMAAHGEGVRRLRSDLA